MVDNIITRKQPKDTRDYLNKIGQALDEYVDYGERVTRWFLKSNYKPHQVVIITNYMDLLEMCKRQVLSDKFRQINLPVSYPRIVSRCFSL